MKLKSSDFWQTPKDLYPKGCFDPCPVNPTFDGLSIDWKGVVFCNPPYSQIELWVDKAIQQINNPKVDSITLLLPNWTDRKWFFKLRSFNILFIQGRLRFTDPKTGLSPHRPRFGSMLIKLK